MAADEATMRDRIRDAIDRFPGIHFRGLVKQLDTSTALVRYHVEALLAAKAIRAVDVGGFRRYFPVAEFRELSAHERAVLQLLRQPRPLEIALALLEFGTLQHRDLLEIVGGSKATLTYHLDKLVDAAVVVRVVRGPERGFHLRDPREVRRLLARYEPLPEVLERVHDTWEDLFGGHRRRGRG